LPALTENLLLSLWEEGEGTGRRGREALLLATAAPELSGEELTVGQRNAVLLRVHARTFGERLDGFVRCPACDEALEVSSKQRLAPGDPELPHTQVHEHPRHALDLLEKVATKALASAGLAPHDIDVIVTNSTTGLAVPSIDALLINRLEFRETVTRLPIFGFGCSGGAAGLARATQLAQSMPGANVLFLTVDLCSLCVRANDHSLTNFVAAALFGDGAAAVVLRSSDRENYGSRTGKRAPRIVATGERLWSKTEHYLGLNIKDDGFGMVLSPALPTLLRENFGPAVAQFLGHHGLSLTDIDGFLIHAGGRKILETAEDILGTRRDQMAHAWSVMRDYGNMSSATVLFVLERALAAGASGRHLLAAFGFGFSAHFAIAEL